MHALGRQIGADLRPGACLGLCGPLGAGKTQLVKGLAVGLGYPGEVTSPTFSLLHEYRGGREALFHLDFYRVETEGELIDLGWDELLEEGVVVAEWADKFPGVLPPETRMIRIEHLEGGGRRVREGVAD
ncbi:MAG: tRNA (adenosine(37)-N6)-threonylcarbamoyltransferase complex ATPase subunit type 1 TsaE [Verrucomicrobia bacterium]|nr:tRNA (adenosine(37)-N6)-threonylcarbamoyltransferase complex ATPase subunit type 1 TsaE [Verrucomicrobiota bacterium]